MIFVGLGVKNQFILAKTIVFSLLVQHKSSVESSINDEVHQKSMFKVHTIILHTFKFQFYVTFQMGTYCCIVSNTPIDWCKLYTHTIEIGMSHCRKRLYVVFQIGILRIEFEMPISTHCVCFLLLKCQSVDKLPYSTYVS